MKLSKANTKNSLIRDRINRVVSDARPGQTYAARCTMKVDGGKVVRVWNIFTGGVKRPRKAKVSK